MRRAKEHRDTFNHLIEGFLNSNPYSLLLHVDYEAAYYELRVHENHGPPDTMTWGLILGDALNNLRSCLDHLAYSLSILDTGQDPPPREGDIQFPIVDDGVRFAGAAARRIPDIGSDVCGAIETLQPYHRLDDPVLQQPPFNIGEHPLWALNKLNNIEKHRLIPVVAAWNGGWRGYGDLFVRDCRRIDDGLDFSALLSAGRLKQGAVVWRERFEVTGPNPVVNMYAEMDTVVMVEGPLPPHTVDTGAEGSLHRYGFLDLIILFVEQEVFGRIARVLRS